MRTTTLCRLRTASNIDSQFTAVAVLAFRSQICLRSQRRLHSSTTASVSSANAKLRSNVNGPPSTLPPPLELPTRAPGEPFFPKYAFNLGKAYASFYKTGVKAIWTNYKASRAVKEQLRSHQNSVSKAIEAKDLDRSALQLLRRNDHDIKRVPIFAVIVLVCGELTPLIVMAISAIVPYTCRIPKQIETDRQRLEERRRVSFRNLTTELPENGDGVQSLNRAQLLHISSSLGLSNKIWDRVGGPPTSILRRKAESHVEYLEQDDTLILRGGGVGNMEPEEIRIALEERGVDVLGRTDMMQSLLLNTWLRSKQKVPVEELLLTRPSAWPVSLPPHVNMMNS